MNTKFDELAKGLAQSVNRRQAFRRFGTGIAGIALATLGIAKKSEAAPGGNGMGKGGHCNHCNYPYGCTTDECINKCAARCLSGF